VICEVWNFGSGVLEDSSFLRCDAVSVGVCRSFVRIVVPSGASTKVVATQEPN